LESDSLWVYWTSGDREVALKMVFMYTLNSKIRGWWSDVNLVVWGPSARLLSQDAELQSKIREMIHVGVNVFACKACTDSYGVSQALQDIGIDVKYMGMPTTEVLKQGHKVLTF